MSAPPRVRAAARGARIPHRQNLAICVPDDTSAGGERRPAPDRPAIAGARRREPQDVLPELTGAVRKLI
jgi:hypothetical protein